jgi:hypothetical protein
MGAYASTGTDQGLVKKIDYINPGGLDTGEYDDHITNNYLRPPWREGDFVESFDT